MKYKMGDRLKCINKSANPTSELVIGNIYEVIETSVEGYLVLSNTKKGTYWSDYQFEKIKKEIQQYGIVKFLEKIEGR